jgi:protein-tyrosine phosphatase
LLLTKPIVPSAFEWLRPLIGKESWDFFCWSDLGVTLGELNKLVRDYWSRAVKVAKQRGRRLYLRNFQQPQTLRRLRGRKIGKVLVLCLGNICRSPLAAALAAKRIPNASFTSAGFYPAVGRHCPDFVLAAAATFGIDLAMHRSKCVDAEMIDEAQLVLIMDVLNYELLKKNFPSAVKKTLFLGMLLPQSQLEIRDPYDTPSSMPEVASSMHEAIDRLDDFIG